MKECVFCRIIKGEKPREIISETKNTISILSNPSQIKGHCLVMPKKHVEKLSELNADEIKKLINEVIKIQEKLLKKYKGCDIKQNYRPFLKNNKYKVSHLHFHIIPRYLEDEIFKKVQINEKEVFKDLSEKELKKVKEEILKNE